MTILVVDDEPTVPRLFDQRYRREIRDGVLRFLYAASGEQALRVIDSGEAIDLVLSDIAMPGMTGLDLLDALHLRRWTKPVWVISAYDGSDFETQALAKGAQGFLAKPLHFDTLNDVIAKLPPQTRP